MGQLGGGPRHKPVKWAKGHRRGEARCTRRTRRRAANRRSTVDHDRTKMAVCTYFWQSGCTFHLNEPAFPLPLPIYLHTQQGAATNFKLARPTILEGLFRQKMSMRRFHPRDFFLSLRPFIQTFSKSFKAGLSEEKLSHMPCLRTYSDVFLNPPILGNVL